MVSSSCSGEVSITARGSPLLRPTVVSSSTGMPAASQPSLPKLTVSRPRWTRFIPLSMKSLGMPGPYAVGDCNAMRPALVGVKPQASK